MSPDSTRTPRPRRSPPDPLLARILEQYNLPRDLVLLAPRDLDPATVVALARAVLVRA